MEAGFQQVSSVSGPGWFITEADLERYADCFRQYRVGYEIGRKNTEIANRPAP